MKYPIVKRNAPKPITAKTQRISAFRTQALEIARRAEEGEHKWSKIFRRPFSKAEVRKATIHNVRELIAKERTRKFWNFETINNALKELARMHAGGLFIKPRLAYSEEYCHPAIGEYAIPGKSSVVFKRKALANIRQILAEEEAFRKKMVFDGFMAELWSASPGHGKPNPKRMAKEMRRKPKVNIQQEIFNAKVHDVAHVALSINLPYPSEKRIDEYNYPEEPINVREFAKEYARMAGIKDQEEFAKRVRWRFEGLNNSHFDYAHD